LQFFHCLMTMKKPQCIFLSCLILFQPFLDSYRINEFDRISIPFQVWQWKKCNKYFCSILFVSHFLSWFRNQPSIVVQPLFNNNLG
jgi:hypothetical protein